MRLLIGSDTGYATLIRAATDMHQADARSPLLVLFGSDSPFSFRPRPSTILVPGMLPGVIAAIPELESLGIASRLASPLDLPGCHEGTVVELAQLWLTSQPEQLRTQTQIVVTAPSSTLAAVEHLGTLFGIRVSSISMLS